MRLLDGGRHVRYRPSSFPYLRRRRPACARRRLARVCERLDGHRRAERRWQEHARALHLRHPGTRSRRRDAPRARRGVPAIDRDASGDARGVRLRLRFDGGEAALAIGNRGRAALELRYAVPWRAQAHPDRLRARCGAAGAGARRADEPPRCSHARPRRAGALLLQGRRPARIARSRAARQACAVVRVRRGRPSARYSGDVHPGATRARPAARDRAHQAPSSARRAGAYQGRERAARRRGRAIGRPTLGAASRSTRPRRA